MALTKKRLLKIAAVLGLTALAGVAVFGLYRVTGAVLDRMIPSSDAGSLPPVSSRPAGQEPGFSAESGSPPESAGSESGTDSAGKPAGVLDPYLADARKRVAQMTLRQEVGQVFLFECPASGAVRAIDQYSPGGYCLTERNFAGKTAAQVRKTLQSYQNSSKIPLLLACDEEGGTVVRISSNPALAPEKFASPRQVFAKGGLSAVTADTEKRAKLLKSLGVNVNLAPVCDISADPKTFIYARSLGRDAKTTAEFAKLSVRAYAEQGVGCVLKHFPGYGGTQDTHTGAARDTRSYQSFQKSDFLPFQAGIASGAACIMISHNTVECMDAERPASLSPQVHEILRGKLGFTGVTVTDSLAMGAVTQYTKNKNAAVEAFLAGNDLLLTPDIAESYNALYQAVKSGAVPKKRLDESAARIVAWKLQLGLLR